MKYSLRSLMIVVLVLPPLLAWGGMPVYRWLTTPKPPRSLNIAKPTTTPPQQATYDPEVYGVRIGYPSEQEWEGMIEEERLRKFRKQSP